MKKMLMPVFFIAGLTVACAQSSLQFYAHVNGANEVPPNSSSIAGSGSFTLNGNTLDFSLLLEPAFSPTDAGIFGPAAAGQVNSMIFDLGSPSIVAPYGGFPGSVSYSGTFTLTSQQLGDLENGLWYVNVLTSTYPNGEVRGQIMPVPEPSLITLLSMSGIMVLAWQYRKNVTALVFKASGTK